MNKIVFSNNHKKIALSLQDYLKCDVEESDFKDVFEVYIESSIVYSINDDFDSDKIDLNIIKSKIEKFKKNKKIRNSSNRVGGLGNINLEEY